MGAVKVLAWLRLVLIVALLQPLVVNSESAVEVGSRSVSTSPFEVISLAANDLQVNLSGRQEYYSENLDELFELISSKLGPVFDIRYSGYLVLGEHWRTADDAQRNRFVKAFSGFLIQSYAKGLLGFNHEDLVIYPAIYSKDKKKAEVKTQLKLANGKNVPVNYRLRNSEEGWRVYDVRVEGVSYIQNYRSQFNAEINALGLDAVISRLEAGQEGRAIEPAATTVEIEASS